MKQDKDARNRIIMAAIKEFAANGYGGSRMERIAKAAKINKAMIFYYFSSKEQLHGAVVKEVFDKITPLFGQLVLSDPTPAVFIEKITVIYMDLFTKYPDFIKMVAMELLQNPKTITTEIKRFFIEKGPPGPPNLVQLLEKWRQQGLLTEEDPFQFMLNIISLGILSFLAQPFVENIFSMAGDFVQPGPGFKQQRIESVVRLLQRGMLKTEPGTGF